MPNATVRAHARAMPMNRRAVFGAIAAGALLNLPRAAKAADLDADLFALAPAIEAADRKLEAVLDVLGIAEAKENALAPEKPGDPPMDRESQEAIETFGRRMKEIRARGPSPEQVAHDCGAAIRMRIQRQSG